MSESLLLIMIAALASVLQGTSGPGMKHLKALAWETLCNGDAAVAMAVAA